MYERLLKLGWVCSACACPGNKGWDCMHKDYPNVLIKVTTNFRILKNSLIIESGFAYQLEEKMKKHEIFKEVI